MALIGAILSISLCFLAPQMWIYAVLLSSYFFYAKFDSEESSQPIIFAMAYHLSLFVWMISHIVLKKKRLIKHWIDIIYLFFIVLLAVNGILSFINDVEFIFWIKGWQLFLIVLYYFPIREIFKGYKQQSILLLVCAIVLIIQGVSHIYQYKMALTNFKFASQLMYIGIRQGGAVFAVASLVTLSGILFSKRTLIRVLLLGLHAFCLSVLTISLSRTAWVGYVAGLFVIGIVLHGNYRKNFLVIGSSLATLIFVVGFFFYGKYFDIAINVVSQRFSSSASFATDPSYLSRTFENEVLIASINEYPLGGAGLQNYHNRYDAINRFNVVNTYAHNNYLGSAQKMGIPLAALFFGILVALFILNWKIARQSTNTRVLFFSISSLSGLVSMLVFNFVGSIFDQREGMFLMVILFAFSFLAAQKHQDSSYFLEDKSRSQ